MKTKILVIAGARPNFMKIAPLMRELRRHPGRFTAKLVHTGQHYDKRMSDVFFRDLGIAKPDIHLNVGPGTHATQTARVMQAFEPVVLRQKPDWVIVVGDVNSTVACCLTAAKLGVKTAHVEAGLRSFDRRMPEELNRLVTDALSDKLFVSEPSGLANLKKEGVPPRKVHYTGNIMIDTLKDAMPKINRISLLRIYGLRRKAFAVLTLHRPANVDDPRALKEIYGILKSVSALVPVVYPVHPRTKKMIARHGFTAKFRALKNLKMIAPLGYVDFMALVRDAALVLTDSGGIQEETTVLKVPCLTMRENTERPATLKGTNRLVGRDKKLILRSVRAVLNGKWPRGRIPRYWDGRTARRIVQNL